MAQHTAILHRAQAKPLILAKPTQMDHQITNIYTHMSLLIPLSNHKLIQVQATLIHNPANLTNQVTSHHLSHKPIQTST